MKKQYNTPLAEWMIFKTEDVMGVSGEYNNDGYLEWDYEGGN